MLMTRMDPAGKGVVSVKDFIASCYQRSPKRRRREEEPDTAR